VTHEGDLRPPKNLKALRITVESNKVTLSPNAGSEARKIRSAIFCFTVWPVECERLARKWLCADELACRSRLRN
jgi:hypothetical protein